MSLRDVFALVGLVVLLQLGLGIVLYLISPVPQLSLAALVLAVCVMATVGGLIAGALTLAFKRYARERALRLILMTLSEDERRVFEAILRAGGEARQDKLRRQLDMSKSKLSALVNNLERKGAITKTPYWKTNILRISEEFSK
jgi:uncharacterized membrane protein